MSTSKSAQAKRPNFAAGVVQMDLSQWVNTPAALAQIMRADLERQRPIVKATGFTAES